jgi:aminopeptidase N
VAAVLAVARTSPGAGPPEGDRDDRARFSQQEWAARVDARELIERDRVRKAEAQVDQSGYDVLHYDLVLDIDPAAETIDGTLTADIAPLESLSSVVLDLSDSLAVTAVRVGGTAASFVHENDLLTVVLFTGTPALHFDTHGNDEVLIYSFSAPTYSRGWWPCKDVLDDKATMRTTVTVPDTLVVASNGLLEDDTDLGNGTRRVTWYESYPITTYLVSLAISNYSVFRDYYNYTVSDSMEVVYYVYPEDLADAQIDFAPTVSMIEFYANTFGEYPFLTEKYGMAEINFGGAMEHQTCTSYGNYRIRGNNSQDWVVAHELSHMWWGDMITCGDWRDIWLNEGFARYCEALWTENTDGRQAYFDYMDDLRYPFDGPFRGSVYDPNQLYNLTVYDKGAWVLHMLRWVMGDARFLNAMRAYGNDVRYAYANAVTDDFQAVCEAEYGKSLEWFFHEWVYSEGEPAYEYIDVKSGSGQRVDLSIVQTQPGFAYEMPLEVRFYMSSGDSSLVAWNNRRVQNYAFTMPETVDSVAVDPDGWVLGDKRRGKFASTPYVEVRPNPFNHGTSIVFETTVAGQVSVTIYDVSGAPVRTLQNGSLPPAVHSIPWDGSNDAGDPAASGVYFVDVHTHKGQTTSRAVLVR